MKPTRRQLALLLFGVLPLPSIARNFKRTSIQDRLPAFRMRQSSLANTLALERKRHDALESFDHAFNKLVGGPVKTPRLDADALRFDSDVKAELAFNIGR